MIPENTAAGMPSPSAQTAPAISAIDTPKPALSAPLPFAAGASPFTSAIMHYPRRSNVWMVSGNRPKLPFPCSTRTRTQQAQPSIALITLAQPKQCMSYHYSVDADVHPVDASIQTSRRQVVVILATVRIDFEA